VQLGLIKVWDEFLEDYGDKKFGKYELVVSIQKPVPPKGKNGEE